MKSKIGLLIIGTLFLTQAAELRIKSIVPQGGIVYPGSSWKAGYQIGVSANILTFGSNFSSLARLDYWQAQSRSGAVPKLALSNLSYGLDIRYCLDSKGLYIGGGISHNHLHKDYQGNGLATQPKALFGAALFTGYIFAFEGYDSIFTELRYSRIENYNILGLKIGLFLHII